MLARFSELFDFVAGAEPEMISSSGTEEEDEDEDDSSGRSTDAEDGRLT